MTKIIENLFGKHAGRDIYQFTLINGKGNSVSIINYGGIITSWMVKDKEGVERNIIAGFNNLEDYINNTAYFGCITGRYANRIANGKFRINGDLFTLARNDGENHLHGGNRGFDKVIWNANVDETADPVLSLQYISKDGEEGYPGNLDVKVNYSYSDNDELIIEYCAQTDKATALNLTNHCYFNLSGDMDRPILDHSLFINADHYLPVNDEQIPTGSLESVDGTAFDFKLLTSIVRNARKVEGGFDHNFVLNKLHDSFSFAASLVAPDGDLQLSVFTTEPGLQLYTGNLLDGSLRDRDGKPIGKQSALCLETQHFPDSPNHPNFPSTILLPGKKYFSKTIYKITTG
ncbi:MAG TPA: aldose epimerase family protein [Puia sp.]|nr:aldose epimerase family protein [Puia sp.]